MTSFDFHSNQNLEMYSWGNQGTEKLQKLPRVAQVVCGRAGVQMEAGWGRGLPGTGIINIGGGRKMLCCGGCPAQGWKLRGLSGPYPLDASSAPPSSRQPKMCPRIVRCPLGAKSFPAESHCSNLNSRAGPRAPGELEQVWGGGA